MKIETSEGPVELTAGMVCRGMVFAPKDPRDYALGEGRVFVVGRRDDANGIWRDARNEHLGTNLLGADRLLGCDPTIASRADCALFGVHGDAAGHGFARLQDGGAVDLRRKGRPGVVVGFGEGQRFVPNHRSPIALGEGQRFVGLNARYAVPEDVRRLCCGDRQCPSAGSISLRCTLAIGDHDEHEDLATGTKWSAEPRCTCNDDRGHHATGCPVLGALSWVDSGGSWAAQIGETSATVRWATNGEWWAVFHRSCLIREGTAENAASAQEVAGRWLLAVVEAAPAVAALMGFLQLLFVLWNRSRAGHEAAIAALVNACPADLDPVAWRAAVLACRESYLSLGHKGPFPEDWHVEDALRGKFKGAEWSWARAGQRAALAAYQRALAPRERVAPERRGAVKRPVGALPCDNGEDE